MRITGIAWRGYVLPFRGQYIRSDSRAASRCGLLVFLTTGDGLVGIGEASPVGTASPGEVARVADALERLAPRLLRSDTDVIEEAMPAWDIPPVLRFGLETALLDLRGQVRGCPVAMLLGGRPSVIPVNALIAAESPERAVREARDAIKLGFTTLKLKVGQGMAQDEALVSAVRQAVGPEARLRIDPNQAWDTDQAIESIRRLSRYGLEYVEQPVSGADIAGLAEVRRAVPVPVAADESLGSLDDMHRLLDSGAADIFVLKAARVGGLKAALDMATVALDAGQPVVVTTSLESGVGVAAAAHLAAVVSSGVDALAQGLATGLLFAGDTISPRLLPGEGMLSTPVGPGLGVRVSAVLLEKYSSEVMGAAGSLSGLEEYIKSARRFR